MSKTYKVSWAAVARNDLKQIIEYIAIDSPGNASRILKKIKNKTSDLFPSPERGKVVPELKEQGIQTYRELIIAPWRIIYRITDTTIFVLSVIDSRRNVEDLLLDRFVNE